MERDNDCILWSVCGEGTGVWNFNNAVRAGNARWWQYRPFICRTQ